MLLDSVCFVTETNRSRQTSARYVVVTVTKQTSLCMRMERYARSSGKQIFKS
jgi:hypothetical protein